ncbi:hypothetical protein GH810_04610 [Acetobacterium paludosum]|uniref:Uncharacterized protein n=1 Tax=Acetobacterium paludosum TaxID=52693 RepID=A0A923KWU6_9FIRM|nr:hypothetical protein [Acetobacterium paludosum]MBC3887586.1 hypothetical protein [Acetobacterium paludosum]
MKYLDDIKKSAKQLLNFKSSTRNEIKETALITECFSYYLQSMANEKKEPVSIANISADINVKSDQNKSELQIKQPVETIRGLIPIKQI